MKNFLLSCLIFLTASAAAQDSLFGSRNYPSQLLQRRSPTPPFPGAPDPIDPYKAAVGAGCKPPVGSKLTARDLTELTDLNHLLLATRAAAPYTITKNDYTYPVPKGAEPIGAVELIDAVKKNAAPQWFVDKLRELNFDCTDYDKKKTGGGAGAPPAGGAPAPKARRSWDDEFEELWVRDEREIGL